jgi:hypothetical protein
MGLFGTGHVLLVIWLIVLLGSNFQHHLQLRSQQQITSGEGGPRVQEGDILMCARTNRYKLNRELGVISLSSHLLS